MKIRTLSLVVSFGYVLIVLFFCKRQLFELAQQAFINEIGVGYIFHMGTAYGVLLASSICLAAVSVKSFVSYIRVSLRKGD